jgi:mRNA-degrading endonuclease RelE of RelBE toxin-antitoxin system
MNLKLSKIAEKQFRALPKSEAKKVSRKLILLKETPFTGKKLQGELANQYSLRAWPYRIIYKVIDSQKLIWVDVIEHHQGVYK